MIRLIIVRLMSVCLIFAICGTARTENWPQFRGPTGQGHSIETNLPTRWSETENVRWKVSVPGKGWSSPIVYEGRVFLTTAVPRGNRDDRDRTLRTLCLDATTGLTIWNVPVFEQSGRRTQPIHGKNSHASPTPITDGRHLFVHFGTQGTACLTLDGEIVWKTRALRYQPQHGDGGSPVLFDDLLIVNCDGADVQYVVALEQKTGEIRWKTIRPPVDRTRKFSFSTPLVIEVDGKKQLVSPGAHSVVAYDPDNGEQIWMARYEGFSVIPRPVFGHGLVFVSSSFEQPTLLAIRPDGRGDVTETHVAWQATRSVPNTPSMLLVGDELYFVADRGQARCVDARTGKLHWRERLGGNYSASPLYADGKIYFQSEQGPATVIRAGKKFTRLARNDLKAPVLASYAVSDSALFIRTENRLFRIQNP